MAFIVKAIVIGSRARKCCVMTTSYCDLVFACSALWFGCCSFAS